MFLGNWWVSYNSTHPTIWKTDRPWLTFRYGKPDRVALRNHRWRGRACVARPLRPPAVGFDRVFAYATAGGSDYAYLYDGSTGDIFVGRPESAVLRGAGNEFYNCASGFDRVVARIADGASPQLDLSAIDFAFEKVR